MISNAGKLLKKAIRINKTNESSIAGTLEDSIIAAGAYWYWKLDETTGTTVVDTMGHDNLTYAPGAITVKPLSDPGYIATSTRADGVGKAKDINKDNQRLIYQDSAINHVIRAGELAQSFTIELAFSFTGKTASYNPLLIGRKNGSSSVQDWGIYYLQSTDKLYFEMNMSTLGVRQFALSASTLASYGVDADGVNHWLSVRFDFSDNTTRLTSFIDGVQVNTQSGTSWNGIPVTTSSRWLVIGNYDDYNWAWDGLLDEVAVYRKAITNAERNNNYTLWSTIGSGSPPSITTGTLDVDVASISANPSNGSYTTPLLTATVTNGSGQFDYAWTSDGSNLVADTPTASTTTYTGSESNLTTTETLTCTVTDVGDSNATMTDTVTTDITWGPLRDYTAQYTMDSISAFVVSDGSGNSHDMTMSSTPLPVSGKDALALEFDGTTVGNIVNHLDFRPSTFTVAMWVNTSTSDNMALFQSYHETATDLYGFWIQRLADRTYRINLNAGSGFVPGTGFKRANTSPGVNGVWEHVVFTYDGLLLKAYLNGVLEDTVTPNIPLVFNATNYVKIGAKSTSTGANELFFTGYMDEVEYYTRAFSYTEVTALYVLPGIPTTPAARFTVSIDPTGIADVVNPSATYTSPTLTANVTAGVGPFTYAWSQTFIDALTIVGAGTSATETVSGIDVLNQSNDIFKCVVTDTGNGSVTAEDTIDITISWGS